MSFLPKTITDKRQIQYEEGLIFKRNEYLDRISWFRAGRKSLVSQSSSTNYAPATAKHEIWKINHKNTKRKMTAYSTEKTSDW